MSRRRHFLFALLAASLLPAPAHAQIFVPAPPPGYGPTGGKVIGYVYQKRTIYSSGYGSIVVVEPRVIVRQPAVVFPPRYEYDLSGIDLDIEPPEKLDPRWPNVPPREVVKRPDPPPREKVPAKPKEEAKKPPEPMPPKEKPGLGEPRDEPVAEGRRLVDAGVAAFQNQQYALAAMRFTQAADVDPTNSKALFFLSQAYFAMGRYKDASRAIEDGMRRQPNWPISHFQPRVDLYKGIEDDWLAHKKQLETVVEQHPKQGAYLFLLGHQLWFDGLREEAGVLFRKARPFVADPTFIDKFLEFAPPEPVAVK